MFESGSLADVLANYDDNAFLLPPNGSVKGTEALGSYFDVLIEEFGQEGTTLKLGDLRVSDDVAYITWTAETTNNEYEIATDTFVVKTGGLWLRPSPGESCQNLLPRNRRVPLMPSRCVNSGTSGHPDPPYQVLMGRSRRSRCDQRPLPARGVPLVQRRLAAMLVLRSSVLRASGRAQCGVELHLVWIEQYAVRCRDR